MKRGAAIVAAALVALLAGTLATITTGLLILYTAMVVYLPPNDSAGLIVAGFGVLFFGTVFVLVFREMLEKFT